MSNQDKLNESQNPMSRRRFIKYGASAAVVVVVAGVGAYLAFQSQLSPSAPATPTAPPAAAPRPTPAPVAPAPSPVAPTPSMVDLANQEGEVMLYSSFDEETLKLILNAFTKKYPKIKGNFFRGDHPTIMSRLMTEYRAKKHIMDVVLATGTAVLEPLQEGMVASYPSPEAAVYPAALKDPNGYWTTFQYSPQAIAYSIQLVKGGDIPTSYWDLVKPRFKDKLGIYDPERAPHSLTISKSKIIGPNRWVEFMNGLKAQNPKMIRGTGPIVTMLKQGEVEVVLWSFTGTLTTAIKKGDPVDYVRRPNTFLSPPSLAWIYKYAPHPNGARLLYDFLLSEEGQGVVNDLGSYVLARPALPPKMGMGIGTGEPIRFDYVASVWPYTEKDLDQAVAEWRTVFPRTE